MMKYAEIINMASTKAIAISVLVLRIITLLCLTTSIIVIATDNYELSNGQNGYFQNVRAYRYVLSTASIGLAYTLLQIPLAIYHVWKDKRSISDKILAPFDFYADKVISFLLATGVGAGFAVSVESKRFVKEAYRIYLLLGIVGSWEWRSKTLNFLDIGNAATGVLLIGFVSMAFVSILSSIVLSRNNPQPQPA